MSAVVFGVYGFAAAEEPLFSPHQTTSSFA